MESLYYETNGVVAQIQSNLGLLENAKDEADAQRTIQFIHQQLKVIEGNCERLDILVGKEPPARRRTAKCRVDQLKYDCQSINTAASSIHTRLMARWRAAAERDELLTRRFRANEPTHLTLDDGEFQLNDRLHSSSTAVDELISHGSAVLDQIRSQGLNLRGVKRRVLDIAQQAQLFAALNEMVYYLRRKWHAVQNLGVIELVHIGGELGLFDAIFEVANLDYSLLILLPESLFFE